MNFNSMDNINNNFNTLNSRVNADNLNNANLYNPQIPQSCLTVRDIRILSDRSIFEEYDARRKTYQFNKDFINDQDSISGPSIIPNMIKNVLCTQLGSLRHAPDFGVNLTSFIFEQLDWVTIVAIRNHIASQLDVNLPPAVEIENIDIKANEDGQANAIDIDITYNYTLDEEGRLEYFEENSEDGPGKDLYTKRVTFTLGVEGFTGFGHPNNTQFRRAR
nr:MAG TPA: Baseplate wedge protein [Caudoviricetes sp.]